MKVAKKIGNKNKISILIIVHTKESHNTVIASSNMGKK